MQRLLSGPDMLLFSENQVVGLSHVQDLTRAFIEEYHHIWQNPNRLKNSRIASVWVHYSGGLMTPGKSPPFSSLSNTTMTNAWKDARNLNVIREDFADMEAKLRSLNNS